jgi:hypothetical protein
MCGLYCGLCPSCAWLNWAVTGRVCQGVGGISEMEGVGRKGGGRESVSVSHRTYARHLSRIWARQQVNQSEKRDTKREREKGSSRALVRASGCIGLVIFRWKSSWLVHKMGSCCHLCVEFVTHLYVCHDSSIRWVRARMCVGEGKVTQELTIIRHVSSMNNPCFISETHLKHFWMHK